MLLGRLLKSPQRVSRPIWKLSGLSPTFPSKFPPFLLLSFPLPQTREVKAKRTSAILLIFSFLLFSSNPKSRFSPKRTLSPSSLYAARPFWRRCCSRAVPMVDFPDAERPVSQRVKPVCLRRELRSARVSPEACQVMLLCGS
jgi:hypothetical protein